MTKLCLLKTDVMTKRLLTLTGLIMVALLASGQKTDMTLFNGIKPRNIGPGGMSGRVTAFAADPRNENVFYIGTASGGLWKTVNAGTTFTPIFDGEAVSSIGSLAVDPVHPEVIWAGTGEGNPRNSVTGGYGIYRSLDGGQTWKCMGLELTRYIHRIIIDPVNPDIVYAGAIGNPWAPHKERGVFRTRDGGKTWSQILFTNETSGVADMVMDPSSPGKIFVAMWDHRRWPWYFESSAAGSGLWVTHDGGDTFTRVREGLPEETGRMGLAIAASRPDYVYAYVESKTTAIYRSTDGGKTWQQRGDKNIGNRPFYYAEIYVDPKNENRIYTLFSGVNVSEDGGLTFPKSITGSVHLDHHAWWIDPVNPDRMLDGNDGGMAISYDRGETWRHIENLPLGQFYHIRTDNETPYNVYGGLQDNGSWRGPAYAWYNGPLINEMFDFLSGGDGFDAMPVAGDPRYCYAQSQGGSIRRYDVVTGWSKSIRPGPEGEERLRFNWNSALAQDPFENGTIYFGSQYIHRSNDKGDTWTKISPDLSTNDPEKQKQDKSGGITVDATGAETHCTVITIDPSPVKQGVIWAGTDDGNIQVTVDGGKNWNNVSKNIKGLPRNCWIPQVTASVIDPATAFVVANDYRQGDNSAYLFMTDDYGKSWKRIIDDTDVSGYVLSFVQDPSEADLMFAGTECGLYVSFDGGDIWNRWTSAYPTVSTYDLAIHPREHDLVIATFGRGIWILDDIRPLRALAKEGNRLLNSKIAVFEVPDAIMASSKNLPGYYFYGDAMFRGENRQPGAMISFYIPDEPGKAGVTITDNDGKVVKTMDANTVKGFNRITWRLDRNVLPQVTVQDQGAGPGGRYPRGMAGTVIPGKYKVTFKQGEETSETFVTVKPDPRLPAQDFAAIQRNQVRAESFGLKITAFNLELEKYSELKTQAAKGDEAIAKIPGFAEVALAAQKAVKEAIERVDLRLNSRQQGLIQQINGYRVLVMSTGSLSQQEEKSMSNAETALAEAEQLLKDFIEKDWAAYRSALEKVMLTGDKIIILRP